MTDRTVQAEQVDAGVPALPADDDNEALLDAHKTLRWTAITAALFVLASLVIIFSTRMG